MEHRRTCPICKREFGTQSEVRYRPFCSKRCADVDLSRWLNGTYAIPAAASAEEREEQGEHEAGQESENGGIPPRAARH